MPALQRARRRLRRRRPRHAGRARRRRVGRQRPEGVDDARPHRAVGDARRPHRPRRAEARGPDATSSSTCTRPASRSGRSCRSPATPSSTRCSSTTSASPTATASAPRATAGRSRITTLMNERVALSGAGSRRRRRRRRQPGRRAASTRPSRPAHGTTRCVRQRLAQAYIEGRLIKLNNQRAAADSARAAAEAGPEGSITKLLQAEYNQRLQKLAVDLARHARAWRGRRDDDGADRHAHGRAASCAARPTRSRAAPPRSCATSSASGSSASPRSPTRRRDLPWKDVPRSPVRPRRRGRRRFAFQVWSYKQGEMVSLHDPPRRPARALSRHGRRRAARRRPSWRSAPAGSHERWVLEWLRGQGGGRSCSSYRRRRPLRAHARRRRRARRRGAAACAFAAGAFGGGFAPEMVDRLADAFRTGIGLTYDMQGPNGAHRTERMLGPWARLALVPDHPPRARRRGGEARARRPRARRRLRRRGRDLRAWPRRIPKSVFDGYDLSHHAVDARPRDRGARRLHERRVLRAPRPRRSRRCRSTTSSSPSTACTT